MKIKLTEIRRKKMQIIDGKAVSASVRDRIKTETQNLKNMGKETGLAVIIVGNDPS